LALRFRRNSAISDLALSALRFRQNRATLRDARTETSTYAYAQGGVWRGVVTGVTTSGTHDAWPLGGSTTPLKPTSTVHAHVWWDEARLATITRDKDTGSSSASDLTSSVFAYDANGRVRTVTIDDAQGQVLRRTEQDGDPAHADPLDRWWWFDGARIGEVTNDGDHTPTYLDALARRARAGPRPPPRSGMGMFHPHKSLLHSFATSRDLARRGWRRSWARISR